MTQNPQSGLRVETIRTDELGDRSYVVHDGRSALVVDPQRDIDRVHAVLDQLGLVLSAVADTHIHNDYLSGGLALARAGDVPYLVAAADEVEFDRTPVADDSTLRVGALDVRVLATPGHTPGHVSYVVSDRSGTTALFSGGSLLYGTVGRTDLIDTGRTRELTVAQYRSARRLAELLPPEALLFPTHGFGSFCASTSGAPPNGRPGDVVSLGAERRTNAALVERDEATFVERTIAGFTPYPSYYVHMAPQNRRGVTPPAPREVPQAQAAELRQRIEDGDWVVDLRPRRSFAAEHLSGTISIELGMQFATYLGWLYPYGRPLVVVAESPDQVASAQRQLNRIGIDVTSAIHGDPETIAVDLPRGSFPIVTFADVADGLPWDALILDVRRVDEVRRDGAIPGALHFPLSELQQRWDELPPGTLWVHCASGFRASIAASLLARAGREVVLIDEPFSAAAPLLGPQRA